MKLTEHKKELSSFICRIYKRGLTTSLGGNISKLVSGNSFIITPSGIDKCNVKPDQIAEITFEGKNLTPGLVPSMETKMHLKIYMERNDINAIIHAHPPLASTFCAMDKEINTRLTGEAWALLKKPVNAGYALMGSDLLADIVAEKANDGNVILMKNHGIICVGKNLLEATERIEALENAAKMTIITDLMNNKTELTDDQLKEIEKLFL